MDDETLLEVIADEQHQIWAHWMRYLFSVCSEADDGSMFIPKEKVDRWQRQMWTPYTDLTDAERESDRHQALKVMPALKNILLALSHFTKRAEEAESELHDLRIAYDEIHRTNQYVGWKLTAQQTARADTAEAALAARDTPCVWAPEKDVWGDDYADDGFRTQCGAWYLSRAIKDGHFCPNCGHPVEVAP